MTRVFLSVGSNIEPQRQIPRCLDLLRGIRDSSLVAESSWYRTLPWGVDDQADFINLAVGMDTCLSPRELLQETQGIETGLDRVRTLKNGPRTIDLDILLFGDRILSDQDLAIPHPGLLLRDFMLVPLIEIAADTEHPGRGLPVRLLDAEIRYRQIVERFRIRPRPPAGSSADLDPVGDSPCVDAGAPGSARGPRSCRP